MPAMEKGVEFLGAIARGTSDGLAARAQRRRHADLVSSRCMALVNGMMGGIHNWLALHIPWFPESLQRSSAGFLLLWPG